MAHELDPAAAPYEPIAWAGDRVRLLDQTLLPAEVRYLELDSVERVAEAITTMRVRGAPAIGITAAYGLALAALREPGSELATIRAALEAASERLGATRPTAVNLRWALERVGARVAAASTAGEARAAALEEAHTIHEEQRRADARMAEEGAALLPAGGGVLTLCNTGPLATGGGGTALGVIAAAWRAGRAAEVFACETRPRLQGARLTIWELQQLAIPHRLLVDGAAASLLASGRVHSVVVGADRIAANGDTANKIGSYGLAVLAYHHDVPFYVAAPTSTIDPAAPDGAAIPIEERDEAEVLEIGGTPTAAAGARALNPAFDVTPATLIEAIVTERGVLRAPYHASIERALAIPAAASP